MADTLLPIMPPPGIYSNGTDYQAKGRWHNGNLVRFYSDGIEPIGGWRIAQTDAGADIATLTGVPRGTIAWRSSTGAVFIALGTTEKLYVIASGTLYDITPAGLPAGDVETTSATGTYGGGNYGAGAYGEGSATQALTEAATWQLDTFGDYLVATFTKTGTLYVWTGNTAVAAVAFTGTNVPLNNAGVVVTPERFVVALGSGGNVRQVSWPSQQALVGADWTVLATNTSGTYPLTTEGRIMTGRRTKNETLIWTDVDLHVMTYIGQEFVYRFTQAGDKCGIISKRAAAIVDSSAFWMGVKNFYVYDGFVRPLPSDVRDYVFTDFNYTQAAKVWAMTIAQYGEVWWFYPSGSSLEVDRYVVYNYRENHWSIGILARTSGYDAGATRNPIMAGPSGLVYEHEILNSRPATTDDPGILLMTEDGEYLTTETGLVLATEQAGPFLESGPIEVGNGDRVFTATQLIPDEKTQGDVSLTIFGSMYPNEAEEEYGPYELGNPTDILLTARQARIRLDELAPSDWRVGILRLGGKLGGYR